MYHLNAVKKDCVSWCLSWYTAMQFVSNHTGTSTRNRIYKLLGGLHIPLGPYGSDVVTSSAGCQLLQIKLHLPDRKSAYSQASENRVIKLTVLTFVGV